MRFKKIFAMLLTGIMTVSMPGAVFASSTEEQIADVQAQKEAAQAELAQQQSDMASLESKKQELESYLEELNAQYTDLTNSVSELGIQAAEKEEQLKTLNTQLEEAKATADKQYQDMKKRIVYMYENGSASMLELLLSSEDLAQFLNRAENIAQISQYDRGLLNIKPFRQISRPRKSRQKRKLRILMNFWQRNLPNSKRYRHLLQAQMRTFSPIFIRSVPARMKSVL